MLRIVRGSFYVSHPSVAACVAERYTDKSTKFTIYWPPKGPAYQLAHELAHAILRATGRHTSSPAENQRELEAWALAKDFLKPELWNETEAVKSLQTYNPKFNGAIPSYHIGGRPRKSPNKAKGR